MYFFHFDSFSYVEKPIFDTVPMEILVCNSTPRTPRKNANLSPHSAIPASSSSSITNPLPTHSQQTTRTSTLPPLTISPPRTSLTLSTSSGAIPTSYVSTQCEINRDNTSPKVYSQLQNVSTSLVNTENITPDYLQSIITLKDFQNNDNVDLLNATKNLTRIIPFHQM